MGYAVELMPPNNPGFDIRATKDGKELKVEVKGHKGTARIVALTIREYNEYNEYKEDQWELWNVENLSADIAERVVLTRYDSIPEEAMKTRTFGVDLAQCHAVERDD